jgi:hypothetical protein
MKKIKAYLESNTTDRIPLIKLIRATTGMGLKESKDFVDAHLRSMYHMTPVFLSEAQFGRLMAHLMMIPVGECRVAQVRRVEIIDCSGHDFSDLG